MNDGKVVYVFPCGGKSFYCNINSRVIELKSEKYRWIDYKNGEKNKGNMSQNNPDWPQNYVKAIYKSIQEYDYVFITNSGRLLCQKHQIEYYSVFPSVDLKEDYIYRMEKRGNSKKVIENMKCNYEKYIADLEKDCQAKKIHRLSRGEYLTDLMEDVI